MWFYSEKRAAVLIQVKVGLNLTVHNTVVASAPSWYQVYFLEKFLITQLLPRSFAWDLASTKSLTYIPAIFRLSKTSLALMDLINMQSRIVKLKSLLACMPCLWFTIKTDNYTTDVFTLLHFFLFPFSPCRTRTLMWLIKSSTDEFRFPGSSALY